MKRLFTFLGLALVLVWISLLFLLLFISGLRPFTTTIADPTTTPTPYNSGLFQNYRLGQCIYVEPDNCEDI